jgi:hypothetical protein
MVCGLSCLLTKGYTKRLGIITQAFEVVSSSCIDMQREQMVKTKQRSEAVMFYFGLICSLPDVTGVPIGPKLLSL